jgi:hypothetical protein
MASKMADSGANLHAPRDMRRSPARYDPLLVRQDLLAGVPSLPKLGFTRQRMGIL